MGPAPSAEDVVDGQLVDAVDILTSAQRRGRMRPGGGGRAAYASLERPSGRWAHTQEGRRPSLGGTREANGDPPNS
jgi:hypothetical protein